MQPQQPAAGTSNEDHDEDEGHEAADDAPEVQEQEPEEIVGAPAARWIGAGAATTAEPAEQGQDDPLQAQEQESKERTEERLLQQKQPDGSAQEQLQQQRRREQGLDDAPQLQKQAPVERVQEKVQQ